MRGVLGGSVESVCYEEYCESALIKCITRVECILILYSGSVY